MATGFKVDAEGNYFFVDRAKDAIRRRRENISSFEVEEQILAHPAVQETAVIGVAAHSGEQDVLAVVVTKKGQWLDQTDLIEFLLPGLAHFMVPPLRAPRRGAPEDTDGEDRKADLACKWDYFRYVGPGSGRYPRETPASDLSQSTPPAEPSRGVPARAFSVLGND